MREFFEMLGDLLKIDSRTPLTWRTSLIALCIVILAAGVVFTLVGGLTLARTPSLEDDSYRIGFIVGLALLGVGTLISIPVVRSHRRRIEEDEMRTESRSTPKPARALGWILVVSGILLGLVVGVELEAKGETRIKTLLLPFCLVIAGVYELAREPRQ